MNTCIIWGAAVEMMACLVVCVSCADDHIASGKPHGLTTAESLKVLVSSEVGDEVVDAGTRLYYFGRDLVVPDLVELLEDTDRVPISASEAKLMAEKMYPPQEYDMDRVCGRAAWMLENITRMDFGFRKAKDRPETQEEISLRLEKAMSNARTWWSQVAKPYHRTKEFLRRVRDCDAPEDQISIIEYILDTWGGQPGWHSESEEALDRRDPGLGLFSVAFYADDVSFALLELLKSDAQEQVKEAAKRALGILSMTWGGGARTKVYDTEVRVEAGMKPEEVLELVKQAVTGKTHIADGCRLASAIPPGRYRIHDALDLLYDTKSHVQNGHWGELDIWIYSRTWENEYIFWSAYWKKYHPNWDVNAPAIEK
jgi:hypothetical protein